MDAPGRIGQARVLSFAEVSDEDRRLGAHYELSHGGPLPAPDLVVIVRDPEEGVVLLLCDRRFGPFLDIPCSSVAEAKAEAAEDFPGTRGRWRDVADD